MGTGKRNDGGSPVMDQHAIQGGVEMLLIALRYRNYDKLQPNGGMQGYRCIKPLTALRKVTVPWDFVIYSRISKECGILTNPNIKAKGHRTLPTPLAPPR